MRQITATRINLRATLPILKANWQLSRNNWQLSFKPAWWTWKGIYVNSQINDKECKIFVIIFWHLNARKEYTKIISITYSSECHTLFLYDYDDRNTIRGAESFGFNCCWVYFFTLLHPHCCSIASCYRRVQVFCAQEDEFNHKKQIANR